MDTLLTRRLRPLQNSNPENMEERAGRFFTKFATFQMKDRDIAEFDRSLNQPLLVERTIETNATSLLKVLEEARKLGVELPALKYSLVNRFAYQLAVNMNASQLGRLCNLLWSNSRKIKPLIRAMETFQNRIIRKLSPQFEAEEAEILRFFRNDRWRVQRLWDAFARRVMTGRDAATLHRLIIAPRSNFVSFLQRNQQMLIKECSTVEKVALCRALQTATGRLHSDWTSEVHKGKKVFEKESSIRECLQYGRSMVYSPNITEVQEMVDILNIRRREILDMRFSVMGYGAGAHHNAKGVPSLSNLWPIFERIRADNLSSGGMENEFLRFLNEERGYLKFKMSILRAICPVLPRHVALEQFENMAPEAGVLASPGLWPVQAYMDGLYVLKMESKNYTKFLVENAAAVVDRFTNGKRQDKLLSIIRYLETWGSLKDFLSNLATHASTNRGYVGLLQPARFAPLLFGHAQAGVKADWLFDELLLRMESFNLPDFCCQSFIQSVRKLGGNKANRILRLAVEFAARKFLMRRRFGIHETMVGMSGSPEHGLELLRRFATVMKYQYNTRSLSDFASLVETAVAHREEFGSSIPEDLKSLCPHDSEFQKRLISEQPDSIKTVCLFINCARAGVRVPFFYDMFARWIPLIRRSRELMSSQVLKKILGIRICSEMEPSVATIMKALQDEMKSWPTNQLIETGQSIDIDVRPLKLDTRDGLMSEFERWHSSGRLTTSKK
eukprot:GHVN01017788.1.p1 GENE.GHVN01017788.1~~GHVN01017788.1.p1  ORF type:complete len:768 (-),score=38.37 GHVN01017788.1:77-2260(-)